MWKKIIFAIIAISLIAIQSSHSVTLEQVNTTSVQTLSNKTLTSVKLNTDLTLKQTTANYTLVWNDPASGRTLTIPDPLGNDTFAFLAATQTFTNKTLTAPVLGGTVTGTYTLGGTPTITSPTISGTVGGSATYTAPVLSGTVTGTYTLGGTPTITSPTINTPKQIHANVVSLDKYATTDICATTTGAIDQIGATVTTLMIPSAATCTANKTVPSTLTLWFIGQGQVTISTAVTLTINGLMEAPLTKIFYLTGTGIARFGDTTNPSLVEQVYPQWWGAKGDGVTDSFDGIQQALNSFSQNPVTGYRSGVVRLTNGTFMLSSVIQMTQRDVTLIGNGPEATTLKLDASHLTSDIINTGTPGDYVSNRVDRITIKDLLLNGGGTTGHGILATHTHYSRFENIAIKDVERGMKFDYSWTNSVDNINITDFSYRGLWVMNSSNTINFSHVYLNATPETTANTYFLLQGATGGGIQGLTMEGAFDENMIWIKDTDTYGIENFYIELTGENFAGSNIIKIGPSDGARAENISLLNGRIWFQGKAVSDPTQNAILIAGEVASATVRNVNINNVRIDHSGGGAWSGDFVEVGSGNSSYAAQGITLQNVYATSASGSPTALRLNSDVTRFTGINNRWPTQIPVIVNNATGALFIGEGNSGVIANNIGNFEDLDTTPTVSSGNNFKAINTLATTITTFDDGYKGQIITIIFTTANTTIAETGNIKLSAAFTSTADDTMSLIYDGTNWYELARSVN